VSRSSRLARGTLAKYAALQVPGLLLVAGGLALAVWLFDLSPRLAGGLIALWIVKDIAMFPVVRIAYEPSEHDPHEHLVGARGIAQARIDPEGWVKIGAELWRARLAEGTPPLDAGARARVVAVQGLIVRVEAE